MHAVTKTRSYHSKTRGPLKHRRHSMCVERDASAASKRLLRCCGHHASLQPYHHFRRSDVPNWFATVRDPDANGPSAASDRNLGVSALPHVVSLVSAFVDSALPRFWSTPRASGRTTMADSRLLERLHAHEPPDMDRYYRMGLFSKALVNAVRADNLEVATWLRTVYCREELAKNAMFKAAAISDFMEEAALGGHLDVIVWLDSRP
ncbi:hypothetical protein FI667_g12882, partial [Globisporangium splendens]